MSEYKISYKLLQQQTEEMQKLSTQMTTLSQRVSAASSKLGQDELLAKARTSLQQCTTKMNDTAQIINTAATLIQEVMGEYNGTEKKNVGQAEGTKAHSRDFYKNPVVISDASADSATAGVTSPKVGGSAYATDVYDSPSVGSQDNTVGSNSQNAYRTANGVPLTGPSGETHTASIPIPDVGENSSINSAVVGTAAAAAGVAAGAAATVAGVKLSGKKKAKENETILQPQQAQNTNIEFSDENSRAILQAEESLKAAKERLDNL